MTLAAGAKWGPYEIIGPIAAGGMSMLYHAHDTRLRREVALKLLSAQGGAVARERLLREARSASALNHPNICTVYEIGEVDGTPYIAMEYIPGRPLNEVARAGLSPYQVLRYGIQIAEALTHAHEHAIVHRDLKSSNIIITPDERAKVLDFGLAKRSPQLRPDAETASASLTQSGHVVGTLAYMAPEVLRGTAADERSDMWALGVVLYEMATGHLPFHGRTEFELTSAILHDPPAAPRVRVSRAVQAIISRCLAKDPAGRYARASEIKGALDHMRPSTPADTAEAGEPRRPRSARRPVASRAVRSLIVLPLEDLNHDPEQEYFADGMTEALITSIAKISALRVISRTTAMQYKNRRKPLPEIGRELNVDAVVEGSVVRAGERVRVSARLVRTSTDTHVWAENYDRELRDVLGLQSEVARAIADEVAVKVKPEESERLRRAPTVSPAAHEAYLRGRFYWNKRQPHALRRGLDYFEQAAEEDPAYALAYGGIADSYLLFANYGLQSPRDAVPKAKAAVRKALKLDPSLSEAHTCNAVLHMIEGMRWREAEEEFRLALRLNGSYATACHWYAVMLAVTGRVPEALSYARRARELDPLSPMINAFVGHMLYEAREYDAAIAQCRSTLELDPAFSLAHMFLAVAAAKKRELGLAVEEAQKGVADSAGNPHLRAMLAFVYAEAGEVEAAQLIVDDITPLAEQQPAFCDWLAFTAASLGDAEGAIRWLERAHQQWTLWSVALPGEPALDPIRTHPRFTPLLQLARAGGKPDAA